MTDLLTERAAFTRMDQSTRHDWAVIGRHLVDYTANTLADRILAELGHMGGEHGGFAVDRLTHSLQTAHLAEQDGHDEEYLVCALVHDIGDGLAPLNHCDLAAAVVKPYVSEANHWMVKNHGVLQGLLLLAPHRLGPQRPGRPEGQRALRAHRGVLPPSTTCWPSTPTGRHRPCRTTSR